MIRLVVAVEIPSRENVTAILHAKGIEREAAIPGVAVAEELLRAVIAGQPGIRSSVTTLAADALRDWLDARADLPPAA